MMAVGNLQVTIRVSTWRLQAVIYVLQLSLAILPLRWAHVPATWLLDALQSRGRLFRFLVRTRLEDSHVR